MTGGITYKVYMTDKISELRTLAENDLVAFIGLVAPYIQLGDVHLELISWLTREDKKDNQLVLLPRGHMKSKIVAYLAAWWITRHPEETILYVSATAALAEVQLYQIKQVLESPTYRMFWPDMTHEEEGKRERWTVSEISVDHPKRKEEGIRDFTVKAIGITGSTTGFHASKVILDDLVTPSNAYTEDGRSKVAALYSQLASIENPGAEEVVVGTRYHPLDLYNTLITMVETIEIDQDEPEEFEVYEVFQRVVETNGEFLWPKTQRKDGKWFGFDAKILARIKAKYVDYTQFYSQYYNNPNSADEHVIGSDKFQYYDRKHLTNEDGIWYFKTDKLNVYAAIDFAFSLKKAADYTAIVVIGVDYLNNYYILEIDRFKTDSITTYFDHILTTHSKWGYRKLRAEVTVAQQAIVKSLKENYIKPNGLVLSIDEFRPSKQEGDKEERISAILEPRYNNLQMWHYRGGNCQSLEEELSMRRPPHDDIKDALANACDIAISPRQIQKNTSQSVLKFHSRFGGVL